MDQNTNIEKNDTELEEKVPFDQALAETGFGKYNYWHTALTGFIIISYGCIVFGTTLIVPASQCELQTNAAQQGSLAAVPIIGVIIGAFLWGFLGDTRGRRNTLIIALISSALVNALASISVNWIMLLILQFLASLLAAGEYSLSMTLLSESVPIARRNLIVLLVSCIFLLAQGIMALLAIPIIPLSFSFHLEGIGIYWNSWRTLLLVYSIPSLISACALFSINESPKFVFIKGDEERSLAILRSIYRTNKGKSAEDYRVKSLVPETAMKPVNEVKSGLQSFKDQVVPLFKGPLLKYTAIMASLFSLQQVGSFMVWLPTIANQFMQTIEQGESTNITICQVLNLDLDVPDDPDATPCALNANALLIVLGVGCIQSVFNALISLVVNRMGRRNMVIVIVIFTGLCGIIVNLVPNAIGGAVFFVVFLLGMVVIGLYTTIVVSLFPTHLRAMAVSLTMIAGRICTVISLQILNVLLTNSCEVGFYVFSALFASSAIIAAFLPKL